MKSGSGIEIRFFVATLLSPAGKVGITDNIRSVIIIAVEVGIDTRGNIDEASLIVSALLSGYPLNTCLPKKPKVDGAARHG